MNEPVPRSDSEIVAWLRAEHAKPFADWDFSYLRGRRHHIGDKPWDYETLVVERLSTAASVVDFGVRVHRPESPHLLGGVQQVLECAVGLDPAVLESGN